MKKLQYLNLTGTDVTVKGVTALKGMTALQSVYLYQTKMSKEDWDQIKSALPSVYADSGGYTLPFLASDTVVNR